MHERTGRRPRTARAFANRDRRLVATASVLAAAALASSVLAACDGGHAGRAAAAASASGRSGQQSAPASSPTPPAESLAASAGASVAASAAARTPAPSTTSATPSPAAKPTDASVASAPRFTATAAPVTAAELGASWHAGCPVGPPVLRALTVSYWGFDNAAHTGTLIVNATVVPSVIKVFATLYAEHFPIRSMRPVAEFGGSDDASMAADNTSAFNCRYAVAPGPPSWSVHAYGEAIDVNTVENPYLEGGKVLPPAGAPYLRRSPYRPGMAVAGGQLVRAFAAVGWAWGGRWSGSPDYQHFSATGG